MAFLQKLGRCLMLPVAVLPLCGLLMGIGYFLCPAAMQGGAIQQTGSHLLGLFLIKAGGAVIDNMALLFVIGIGMGLAEENDGVGGIAAVVSWLMITTLLSTGVVRTLIPSVQGDTIKLLAFDKVANPFIGIVAGIIGAACYNRFHTTKLPDWLSFFSGRRCVAIVAGLVSIVVSVALLFVWPLVFGGLVSFGQAVASLGAAGAGIYAFLNRLLIPLGLHHALNNVFWFDTIGLGDLTHFWAGQTSADVDWSLGMYMSGYFPCMMFGVPGAVLAILQSAKNPQKRRQAAGLLLSAAICSFVSGVTEPFEFAFMFLAPALYFVYAVLYGIFSAVVALAGFRAGFCFSAGALDLLFSSSLPAAENIWMIVPLGAAAFLSFYALFRFMIVHYDLPVPGREADEAEAAAPEEKTAGGADKFRRQSEAILAALGGKENIVSISNCLTRLRLEVGTAGKVDEAAVKKAGAAGIVRVSDTNVQVVIGMNAHFVADELKKLCK